LFQLPLQEHAEYDTPRHPAACSSRLHQQKQHHWLTREARRCPPGVGPRVATRRLPCAKHLHVKARRAPRVLVHRRTCHHQGLIRGRVQTRLQAQRQLRFFPDLERGRCSIIWKNSSSNFCSKSSQCHRWALAQPAALDHEGYQPRGQTLGQFQTWVPCLLTCLVRFLGFFLGSLAETHLWVRPRAVETGDRWLHQGRNLCDWCRVPGARAQNWSCGTNMHGFLQRSSGIRTA